MNLEAVQMRAARSKDRDQILEVHRDAFGDEEGAVIANLVEEMLDDATSKPFYSFVAELGEQIVGHVLFTSARIEPDDKATSQILAPLAVTSDLRDQGIGTRLVKESLARVEETTVELAFVLGYPAFYVRFGFCPAEVRGFRAPYPIPQENADAWMVRELKPGAIKSHGGTVNCCKALSKQQYWAD